MPGSELFISDLHLSPDAPTTFERFRAFLAGPARQAARLRILGDLFDYWAGDDTLAEPFNAGVVRELRALTASGVPVDFLPGNRDFLIGDAFIAATGMTLLPDPCVRAVAGVPTLLTHGDTLCTDDVEYLRFRATVRSPDWRAAFLAQPLAERKQAIEALRTRSEAEKRGKPAALMDANDAAVAAAFAHHAVQALIHGHTHRQACHRHDVDGHACRRWVLGDWHPERGSVLACAADGWSFLTEK